MQEDDFEGDAGSEAGSNEGLEGAEELDMKAREDDELQEAEIQVQSDTTTRAVAIGPEDSPYKND